MEDKTMELFGNFLFGILVGVVTHLICKLRLEKTETLSALMLEKYSSKKMAQATTFIIQM